MSKVITIHREYGAGGRSLARALSEKLSIPWYDKDFVRETAKISGYSEDEVKEDGEELTQGTKILDSILNNAASYTSPHDAIYEAEKQVVLDLSKCPCIIVGRTSNIILKNAGADSLDVYLYAPLTQRIRRAEELGQSDEKDLQTYIEKIDRKRQNFCKTYAKADIRDYRNYDLVLNTGILSVEECVDLIVAHY